MKLWVDGKAGSAGSAIRATVKDQVTNINRKVGLQKAAQQGYLYRICTRRATGKKNRKSAYALERTGEKRKFLRRRGCHYSGT